MKYDGYKRTEKERGEDLLLTIELKDKGYTFREIADYINSKRDYSITYVQVHKSYSAAIQISEPDEIAEHRRQGVELMELIKNEAFDSWNKSKGTVKETTKKGILNKGKGSSENSSNLERQEQTIKESESAGNPAYLATIIKAEERKSKFLGTDAKEEISNDVTIRIIRGNGE